MKLSEAQKIHDLSLEEVIEELADARGQLEAQQQAIYLLERSAIEGMEKLGATIVTGEDWEATLSTPITYDYSILARLREITSPDDLRGYTPERDVVKREAERWNMTQAKALAKLSHQHREIIEDAKIFGRSKIQFKAKRGGR